MEASVTSVSALYYCPRLFDVCFAWERSRRSALDGLAVFINVPMCTAVHYWEFSSAAFHFSTPGNKVLCNIRFEWLGSCVCLGNV